MKWSLSSAGRASALQAGGHRFEPCRPVTAEVDGSSPFQVAIFLFKFIFGFIAQLVEQRTENPCVTGSIPVEATKKTLEKSKAFFMVYKFYKQYSHLLLLLLMLFLFCYILKFYNLIYDILIRYLLYKLFLKLFFLL